MSHTHGRLPSLENAEIPRGVSSSPRSHPQNHRCLYVHGRVDAEPFVQPVGGVCTLLSQGGAHLLYRLKFKLTCRCYTLSALQVCTRFNVLAVILQTRTELEKDI